MSRSAIFATFLPPKWHKIEIFILSGNNMIGFNAYVFDDDKAIPSVHISQKCSEMPFLPLLCHLSGKKRIF